MKIPSGWLAMKYGAKVVVGVGVFGGSITTILCAPVATVSYVGLIILRFLTGLFSVC